MLCVWEEIESPNERGWRRVKCTRCGKVLNPTPSKLDRIFGVCHAWPEPNELGHWLTLLLAAVCVRKEGYLWLKAKLGLAPKCGCSKREAKLNTLGKWLGL